MKILTTMNKSSTKCHEEDEQLVAWDDVTGAMLDPDLVMEARKAEMVYFKKMNVYEKVPKSEMLQGNWQSSYWCSVG